MIPELREEAGAKNRKKYGGKTSFANPWHVIAKFARPSCLVPTFTAKRILFFFEAQIATVFIDIPKYMFTNL